MEVAGWVPLQADDRVSVAGHAYIFKSYLEKTRENGKSETAGPSGENPFSVAASRLLGFGREITAAALFGAGRAMDAFSVSLTVVGFLARTLGTGGMQKAFMPVFAGLFRRGPRKKAWEAASPPLTATLLLSLLLTAAGIFLAPAIVGLLFPGLAAKGPNNEAAGMMRILFPGLFLGTLAAILAGFLRLFHRSASVELASLLYGAGAILGIFLFQAGSGSYALALGVLLGFLLQILLLAPVLVKTVSRPALEFTYAPSLKIDNAAGRKYATRLAPVGLGEALAHGPALVEKFVAASLRVGSLSYLYFATEIFRLPFTFLSRAIQRSLLKDFSESAALLDREKTKKIFLDGLRINLFLLAPASILMVTLANPIVSLLLERFNFSAQAVTSTALALQFYAIGLIGWGIHGLTTRILQARLEERTSLFLDFFLLAVQVPLVIWLARTPLQFAGIALATSISYLIFALVRIVVVRHKLRRDGIAVAYRGDHRRRRQDLQRLFADGPGHHRGQVRLQPHPVQFASRRKYHLLRLPVLHGHGRLLSFLADLQKHRHPDIQEKRKRKPAGGPPFPAVAFPLPGRRVRRPRVLQDGIPLQDQSLSLQPQLGDQERRHQADRAVQGQGKKPVPGRDAVRAARATASCAATPCWPSRPSTPGTRRSRRCCCDCSRTAISKCAPRPWTTWPRTSARASTAKCARPSCAGWTAAASRKRSPACGSWPARGERGDLPRLQRLYLDSNSLIREEVLELLYSFYRRNLLTPDEIKRPGPAGAGHLQPPDPGIQDQVHHQSHLPGDRPPMIIWISDFFANLPGQRLMTYITFRALMAVLTSFAIGILLGRRVIRAIYQLNFRDRARDFGDMSPRNKDGTPTMGGLIIFFSLLISVLLWGSWKKPNNFFLGTIIFTAFWFTALGFFDDYLKNIRGASDLGMNRGLKLFLQSLFGLILGLLLLSAEASPFAPDIAGKLFVPFLKYPVLDLGIFYYPFIILVIIAIANSINFADGLDGLATVPAGLLLAVYAVFAYIIGNSRAAKYLWFPFINGAGELVVVLAALIGALAAFLWFNAYPAEIFMGDTGSLLIGGITATSAVLLKHELLFLIAGGVFVIEFLSVFIQDYIGIKLLKRRIFYRAPIHHYLPVPGHRRAQDRRPLLDPGGDLHPGQPDQHQAALKKTRSSLDKKKTCQHNARPEPPRLACPERGGCRAPTGHPRGNGAGRSRSRAAP